MRQRTREPPAEQVVKDIRRAMHKQYGAEEEIRIVLEGLRSEESYRRTLPGAEVLPRASIATARRNFSKPARKWLTE